MSSKAAPLAPSLKTTVRRMVGPRLLNLRFLNGAHLAYRPGHFYSPICAPDEIARRYRDPAATSAPVELPGIDLNDAGQLALWQAWRDILAAYPFIAESRDGWRYHTGNRNFAAGDSTVLYAMLRHFQPKRLIEIGSGFSSACALDTNERFLGGSLRASFIEPYPELLQSLLNPADAQNIEIVPSGVQDVAPQYFSRLEANDILFIDSTHIVKTGSDVCYELFEILPRLAKGVVIHIHDIHYPFEYPREWVVERNYSWNEVYAVRAFLQYNAAFEVLFFNDYFAKAHGPEVERDAPQMVGNPGGGLWLRKIA